MNADLQALYARAKECYDHRASMEDVRLAQMLFRELGDYERSADYVGKCDLLLKYELGNFVAFGRHNGAPICWKVVAERGRMRLLLAEDALFCAPYNGVLVDMNWAFCTLRRTLNERFLKSCFTPAEQALISVTRNENPRNPTYFTAGGPITLDKIFLFSQEEAERILPDPEQRSNGDWWWLRSPGSNLLSAMAVYADGSVYVPGIHIVSDRCGVRPALWRLLRV